MCDFWVSQARHYCNYCKVWTSGSKESVRRHEEGARHKDRVAQILKKKRQGPRVPADARNLQKQLADIEAAAAASMGASARGERGVRRRAKRRCAKRLRAGGQRRTADDVAGHGRGGRAPCAAAARVDGPDVADAAIGGRRRGDGGPTSRGRRRRGRVHRARRAPGAFSCYRISLARASQPRRTRVRAGVLYFAGERHPDKLRTRGVCEVWLESADAWVPATILKVKRHAKGAEGGEARTYDVRLLPRDAAPAGPPPAPDRRWPPRPSAGSRARSTAGTAAAAPLSRTAAHLAAVARDTTLRDLAAADLRVAAVDGAYVPRTVDCDDGADAPPPESVRPAAPIARDEATGLGVWQTVAVRQVDDAAEASAEAHRRENADAARDKRDRQRREAAGSIDDRARRVRARRARRGPVLAARRPRPHLRTAASSSPTTAPPPPARTAACPRPGRAAARLKAAQGPRCFPQEKATVERH